MEFAPVDFRQMASLIHYYNASRFHYLYVSADAEIGKHIGIMSGEADFSLKTSYPIEDARVPLPDPSSDPPAHAGRPYVAVLLICGL